MKQVSVFKQEFIGKTSHEIAQFIFNYYSEDRSRCSVTSEGTCLYNSPNGNQCGFRMMINDDLLSEDEWNNFEGETASRILRAITKGEKLPNYSFFNDIQGIHDSIASHPNESGEPDLRLILESEAFILKDLKVER